MPLAKEDEQLKERERGVTTEREGEELDSVGRAIDREGYGVNRTGRAAERERERVGRAGGEAAGEGDGVERREAPIFPVRQRLHTVRGNHDVYPRTRTPMYDCWIFNFGFPDGYTPRDLKMKDHYVHSTC